MHWLFGALRLRHRGILGINRRNAACILDRNPRQLFPLVDDKVRMHTLCQKIGVPSPAVFAVVRSNGQLGQLAGCLRHRPSFVIKPNRGSAGRGVLVVVGQDGAHYLRHSGERLRLEELRQHVSDTLSGMYSLGGHPDEAIIQQRIDLHPCFERVTFKGIPDVRVVLYRGEPAMAMLRLPTRESNGRANLHQGGIGAGIDLATGVTHHAVRHNRLERMHPDTGVPVIGLRVPYWAQVLEMSRKVADAVGLGYIGVDIVVDREMGPMLLEANARPGLAIQIANGRGLLPRLEAIDRIKDSPARQGEKSPVPQELPVAA